MKEKSINLTIDNQKVEVKEGTTLEKIQTIELIYKQQNKQE